MCPSSTPALRRTARWRSPPRAHGRTYSKPRVWVARARRVSVRQRVQSVSVLMTVTRLDTVCCAAPAAALRPREEEARPSFSTCEGGPWVESQTAAVLGRGSWRGVAGWGFSRARVRACVCTRVCACAHDPFGDDRSGRCFVRSSFCQARDCHSRWRRRGGRPAGPVGVTPASPCAQFLPVYRPSEEEKEDPALYANNVRRVMAE